MNKTDIVLEIQYFNKEWETRDRRILTRIISDRGISIWKTYTIGRNPENCDIYIPWVGSLMGRFQATLIRNAQDLDYWIIDGLPNKPSRNGIAVNGVKVVRRQLLNHGDIITLAAGVRALYFNPPSVVDNLEITLTGIPVPDEET